MNQSKIINLLNRVLNNTGRKLKKQDEWMYWSPFVSHHKPKLQINIQNQNWHCWVSNQGGRNLFQLLKKVGASREHFEELSELVDDLPRYKKTEDTKSIVKLPDEFKPLWNGNETIVKKHALNYLKKRCITSEDILKYNIGYCDEGIYSNRIIIPSYDTDGQLNFFVGRDFYNSTMKYKNSPTSKDIVGFELFINWDEPIVLCEGIFDAIAIKRNAIPLFGKTIPKSLMKKIYEKKVRQIYILLDNDAVNDSIKITDSLMRNGIKVYYVKLTDKDPSDMGFESVTNLIKVLRGMNIQALGPAEAEQMEGFKDALQANSMTIIRNRWFKATGAKGLNGAEVATLDTAGFADFRAKFSKVDSDQKLPVPIDVGGANVPRGPRSPEHQINFVVGGKGFTTMDGVPTNIKKKTVFIVEISSYQISYSKIFKPNFGVILNISHDHLERHKTFSNYVKTKLKLIFSMNKNDYAFLNKADPVFKNILKTKKLNSKIINVRNRLSNRDNNLIKNSYFNSLNNQQNLSFIIKICSILKVKKSIIFKVVNNFKPLNFRQEIIHDTKRLMIINDSKSTSFSSSINLLNNFQRIYWILGGLPKKGDKLNLEHNKNISKIYLYGEYKSFFIKFFKNKYKYSKFLNLEDAIKQVRIDIKKIDKEQKINLIFSPCSASFDRFKNFEERGKYFNYLVSRYKIKNVR